MYTCIKCGKPVDRDGVGLTKKLINRGATEYMCKECLAQKFDVTVEVLDKKIQEFKEMGCSLFCD